MITLTVTVNILGEHNDTDGKRTKYRSDLCMERSPAGLESGEEVHEM